MDAIHVNKENVEDAIFTIFKNNPEQFNAKNPDILTFSHNDKTFHYHMATYDGNKCTLSPVCKFTFPEDVMNTDTFKQFTSDAVSKINETEPQNQQTGGLLFRSFNPISYLPIYPYGGIFPFLKTEKKGKLEINISDIKNLELRNLEKFKEELKKFLYETKKISKSLLYNIEVKQESKQFVITYTYKRPLTFNPYQVYLGFRKHIKINPMIREWCKGS